MKRLIPAVIAIALGLGGAYWYSAATQAPDAMPMALEAQESGDATDKADLSLVEDMSMGNPDAKVTVIEYASFTCPHCKHFHDEQMKEIKKNYIDTDKINFIYREVYFDRAGLWAGMVARCAGPLRYFGLSGLIFDKQSEWAIGEPAEVAANLRRIGKTGGLSDQQLDACMQDSDKAKALVATWEKNGAADDINSTPSFIINGKKYSNMSYPEFAKVLDEKLGE